MTGFVVLYDACVLYPAPLRDLLMHMALAGLYQAKWSAAIHDEWTRNVLASRPDLTPAQLDRTRKLMDFHVRDGLVEKYEDLIETVTLPDPDDRHVLAAAISSKADVILTFNLKDFPSSALTPYGIEAEHPDAFLTALLDFEPGTVCARVKRHRQGLKNPPKSVAEYFDTIQQQGLPQFVAQLRSFAALL